MVIVSHRYAVVWVAIFRLSLEAYCDRLSPGGVSPAFSSPLWVLIARSCEHYPGGKKFFLGTHFEAFPRASICCYFDCVCTSCPMLSTLHLWSILLFHRRTSTFNGASNYGVHQLPGGLLTILQDVVTLRCGRFLG